MAFKPLPDVVNVDRQEAEQAKQTLIDSERGRLLAIKQALLVTSATPGWFYLKQIAGNITAQMATEALDAKKEDRDDAIAKARASKEIFQKLFTVIETTMTFGTDDEPSWFSDLGEFVKEDQHEF